MTITQLIAEVAEELASEVRRHSCSSIEDLCKKCGYDPEDVRDEIDYLAANAISADYEDWLIACEVYFDYTPYAAMSIDDTQVKDEFSTMNIEIFRVSVIETADNLVVGGE